MWKRFTERARAAVYFAQEEAARRRLPGIGPECLLLGVLQNDDSAALAILRALSIDREELVARLEPLFPEGGPASLTTQSLTPGGKRALELAYSASRAQGCEYVGTEHLLLGIATGGDDVARVLAELGATVERVRAAIDVTVGGPEAERQQSGDLVAEWLQSDVLGLRGVSLLSVGDLTRQQLSGILTCAEAFRRARIAGEALVDWKGRKSLALLFEKPSLRTRVTFELGMAELGGTPIVLGPNEVGLGKRESVADVARNLDRWVSAVVARVFRHETLVEMHRHSSLPIINALSDREHPCQTLADLQTLLQHKGRLEGLRIAWVGDGNNVLHSLMLGAATMGATVTAACPAGYEPDPAIVAMARHVAHGDAKVEIVNDPLAAVRGADAVYTDVWVSMGHEAEADQRRLAFEPFRVTRELLAEADRDAVFMHCLPAHRGEEVTDEVLDGPQSVVLDQAENRLHAQKAVLALTIGP